jgi:hypothetical protein
MYMDVVPWLDRATVGIATPGPEDGAVGVDGVGEADMDPRGFVLEHIGSGCFSGLLIQLSTSTDAYFGLMSFA